MMGAIWPEAERRFLDCFAAKRTLIWHAARQCLVDADITPGAGDKHRYLVSSPAAAAPLRESAPPRRFPDRNR